MCLGLLDITRSRYPRSRPLEPEDMPSVRETDHLAPSLSVIICAKFAFKTIENFLILDFTSSREDSADGRANHRAKIGMQLRQTTSRKRSAHRRFDAWERVQKRPVKIETKVLQWQPAAHPLSSTKIFAVQLRGFFKEEDSMSSRAGETMVPSGRIRGDMSEIGIPCGGSRRFRIAPGRDIQLASRVAEFSQSVRCGKAGIP